MIKSVMINVGALGGLQVQTEMRWNDPRDEIASRKANMEEETDGWKRAMMYINLVLSSKPRRNRLLASSEQYGLYEYMDERAAVALPNALEAIFSLTTEQEAAERLFVLFGELEGVKPVDGGQGLWLKAQKGFRAKVLSILRKYVK